MSRYATSFCYNLEKQTKGPRRGIEMQNIRLRSCAKINLSLGICGRRNNGYHDIESFMQAVGMYDDMFLADTDDIEEADIEDGIYFSERINLGTIGVTLCINDATVGPAEDNLAVKGIRALVAELRRRGIDYPAELSVIISKKLPVAAGIAGGSGNAACAMLGLNSFAEESLSLRELMEIGAGVGADVPFSIMMNAAMNRAVLDELDGIEEASIAAEVSGIGEIVKPADPIERYAILVNPGVKVSTKEVYEAIDALPVGKRKVKGLWKNVMEAYTLKAYAEAGELKAFLDSLNAEHVLMSGSGPTMVAYYTTLENATIDLRTIKGEASRVGRNWRVWLTETGKEKTDDGFSAVWTEAPEGDCIS